MSDGNDAYSFLFHRNRIDDGKVLHGDLTIAFSGVFAFADLVVYMGHRIQGMDGFMDLFDHTSGDFRFRTFQGKIAIDVFEILFCTFP